MYVFIRKISVQAKVINHINYLSEVLNYQERDAIMQKCFDAFFNNVILKPSHKSF
jgi:hypothetical protein